MKIDPDFSDGEAEATEPLSPTITSDVRVKEELGSDMAEQYREQEDRNSEMAEQYREQENSAALQWDDAEAEHAMEVAQIKNEEIAVDESANCVVDGGKESTPKKRPLLTPSERLRLEYEYGLYSTSSYHSEDTDDYEMDHRPWEDRPVIKRDIYGIIESMLDIDIETTYKIVDRLGEGTSLPVQTDHRYLFLRLPRCRLEVQRIQK